MNKTILSGRVVREPEVNTYGKGKDKGTVARITVAVRDGKDADGVDQAQFIRCVAFGKLAEVIEKFTDKGQVVSLCGRLRNSSYEDEDGVTRYNTDVIIEDFDLFGKSNANSEEDKEDEEDEEKPKKNKKNTKKYHR